MSKTRTTIAYRVFCSEAMDELSHDVPLLYLNYCFESNLIGEIARPKVLARGLGFDDAALESLVDAGFVLAVDDVVGTRYFIRHHFINNGLANASQKSGAAALMDEASHLIEFEGEPYKSAYRVVSEDSSTDSLNVGETEPQEYELNRIELESNRIESEEEQERSALRFAPCPECNAKSLIGPEGHLLHGTCPECDSDFFIDPKTGEYTEGI